MKHASVLYRDLDPDESNNPSDKIQYLYSNYLSYNKCMFLLSEKGRTVFMRF